MKVASQFFYHGWIRAAILVWLLANTIHLSASGPELCRGHPDGFASEVIVDAGRC